MIEKDIYPIIYNEVQEQISAIAALPGSYEALYLYLDKDTYEKLLANYHSSLDKTTDPQGYYFCGLRVVRVTYPVQHIRVGVRSFK